jgi:hypothetical protein
MKLSATNKTAIDFILPLGVAAFIFYSIYKKKGDVKEAGILALIVAGIGYVITSQVTKSIVAATANSLSQAKKEEISQKYGASAQEIEAAQERARLIYTAFYGADGNAWTEDEDGAAAAINQCSTVAEVKLTCQLYQATYGKSLAGDFSRFTSGYNNWQNPVNPIVKANWF